jgi:hypothetical protein
MGIKALHYKKTQIVTLPHIFSIAKSIAQARSAPLSELIGAKYIEATARFNDR